MGGLTEFHFLRPWWLLLLAPAAWLTWRLHREADPRSAWRGVVAEHLLNHLIVRGDGAGRAAPVYWLGLAWFLGSAALAGPTWRREPAPFADDQATLVIVLKASASMTTEDAPPTRLARSAQKIADLLKLRPGARTALVAYSGSAHRVLPPTKDAEIVSTFADELAPDVLPKEGDVAVQALELADRILAEAKQPGWILWIADGVAADQAVGLRRLRAKGLAPTSMLIPQAKGAERDGAVAAAAALGAEVVPLSPDDADVHRLASRTSFSQVDGADGGARWSDAGYGFVPFLAGMALLWFRRGWGLPDEAPTEGEAV